MRNNLNVSSTKAEARPRRKRLGQRNVLKYHEIPGYRLRFVNDVEDRVEQMKELGYEPVQSHELLHDPDASEASQIGSIVSKSARGGMKGVLMKIKEEWYEENQADKQAEVDEREKSLLKEAEDRGISPNLGRTQLPGINIQRVKS